MAAGTQARAETDSEQISEERPEITVCESSPGRSVFIETGNTDRWISSDVTVEVTE